MMRELFKPPACLVQVSSIRRGKFLLAVAVLLALLAVGLMIHRVLLYKELESKLGQEVEEVLKEALEKGY